MSIAYNVGMSILNIIELLSGVALFLFGMSLMSDGLKAVAGNKMELVLYRLSGTTLKGVLLGIAVTAVIQSSSATSVMVVGFVNSSMMTLFQALGIILGSIFGTSITGWIIALGELGSGSSGIMSLFSTAALTGIIAIAGIIIKMTAKTKAKKNFSLILLGFAVLMYGISAMSGAVSELKSNPEFISMITRFSNPVLGFTAGILITAVLQSASSATGLLQTLAVTGIINFSMAFPILLGINIGASVPVILSSVGAKSDAKRSAYSYLLMSVAMSLSIGILYYVLNPIIGFGFSSAVLDAFGIALLNSLFRLLGLVLVLPFLKLIEKQLRLIIKDNSGESEDMTIYLEERFLASPDVALAYCREAISAMAKLTEENMLMAMGLISEFNGDIFAKVEEGESSIDRYEDKLGAYLVKLTATNLTDVQSQEAAKFLHAIGDLERISDHSLNISECAEERYRKKILFSDEGWYEIKTIMTAVTEVMDTAISAFLYDNLDSAYHVEPLEDLIDDLCDDMKLHHVERLREGKCTLENGFVFNDLITNFERVSDHCSNLALAVIEMRNNMFDPHKYIEDLKLKKDELFEKYSNEYRQRYKI